MATDFAFAAFWLMPRLQRFHEAYPQVDVSLVTGERSQGMLRPDIDVAVLFGDGRFHQGESRWLFDEEVFRCAAPADSWQTLVSRGFATIALAALEGRAG